MINIVFKRYIKKDGRELGPYYYKNVRDEAGNVKSIYVGKEKEKKSIFPSLSFKTNIVILLLILIIIAIYINPPNLPVINFSNPEKNSLIESDQFLIKLLVKEGESASRQIKLTNMDADKTAIQLGSTLPDLTGLSETSFAMASGETKTIDLRFITQGDSTKFTPNVYTGKLIASSVNSKTEIPIIIEIESKDLMFDTNLGLQAYDRKIYAGDNFIANINLFNLKTSYPTSVDMEFFIKDFDNNNIIRETENVVVQTKTSFTKSIAIPENIRGGTYVFAVISKYGSSTGTSSYIFEIIKPERSIFSIQFIKENPLNFIFILVLFIMIFIIGSYTYFLIGSYAYGEVKRREKIRRRGIGISVLILAILAVLLAYRDKFTLLFMNYWPLILPKLTYIATLTKNELEWAYSITAPLATQFYNSIYFSTAIYAVEGIFALLIIYGIFRKFRKQD